MRPRERLLRLGAQSLTAEELLAVLLRTGVRGKGVLELSRELLARFRSLASLLSASPAELAATPGLGPAKRAEICAVLELARRAAAQSLQQRNAFESVAALKRFAVLQVGALDHECFVVLFLDVRHRLIGLKTMFRGTLTQASVYPREVVREALAHAAASVVLVHNHPSGMAEPSRADEHLTHALVSALRLVDVRVLDHLVVGSGDAQSFAERGLL